MVQRLHRMLLPENWRIQLLTKKSGEIKDNDCDAVLPLFDGDYMLEFVIVEKATSGLKDTLKTQVRLVFSSISNVLKTKHDTAKNSISNIR